MSDVFGYGGGYSPYDQQQAGVGMGAPMNPVSGGPDMFQFNAPRNRQTGIPGFDPGSIASKHTTQSTQATTDINRGLLGEDWMTGGETYKNPLADLGKKLNLGVGAKQFGNIQAVGDIDKEWDYLRSIGRGGATPESQLKKSVSGLGQEGLKGLSGTNLSGIFTQAGQNIADLYSSDVYAQQARGKYGLAGDYASQLKERTGNLNNAYQTLVNKMSKYYYL
jgi:hypothetical protein